MTVRKAAMVGLDEGKAASSARYGGRQGGRVPGRETPPPAGAGDQEAARSQPPLSGRRARLAVCEAGFAAGADLANQAVMPSAAPGPLAVHAQARKEATAQPAQPATRQGFVNFLGREAGRLSKGSGGFRVSGSRPSQGHTDLGLSKGEHPRRRRVGGGCTSAGSAFRGEGVAEARRDAAALVVIADAPVVAVIQPGRLGSGRGDGEQDPCAHEQEDGAGDAQRADHARASGEGASAGMITRTSDRSGRSVRTGTWPRVIRSTLMAWSVGHWSTPRSSWLSRPLERPI